MLNALKKMGGAALFVLPLTISLLGFVAHAQQGNAEPAASTEATDELNEPGLERQEVREEMQRIRAEHEDLEARHDLLKTQCMNVKGQEHQECQQKWRDLNDQKETLHARMKALHEKMIALRQEYHNEHPAMNNDGEAASVPQPNH